MEEVSDDGHDTHNDDMTVGCDTHNRQRFPVHMLEQLSFSSRAGNTLIRAM